MIDIRITARPLKPQRTKTDKQHNFARASLGVNPYSRIIIANSAGGGFKVPANDAHEISVKLRGPTGGKIKRNPHHLEQAIKSLAQEVLALNGPESLYRIVGDIAAVYAADREMPANSNSTISAIIECVINMTLPDNEPRSFVAERIVAELRDMELIDKE